VKHSPITRAARATLSLFALAAWLAAANHCVVASFLPKTPPAAAEHARCPGHQTPEQDQPSGGCDGNSCCKSLSAPLATAKAAAHYNAFSFVTKDFPASCTFSLGEQHLPTIAEVDTGPPRSTSFAESVLQRSILAHAPPLFA